MRHDLALIWSWLVRLLTGWLPDSAVTMRFRGWLLGLMMKQRGRDFQVAGGVRLIGLEHISVGDHVYMAPGVALLADCEIAIGSEVMLAYYTVISDGNHTRLNSSFRKGRRRSAPVSIGDGSWVGANSTIVAGVKIGRGVVVGANSVVARDVPDWAFAAGVPARVVRVDRP